MHLLAGLVWAHASLVSVPVSQNPDTARDRPLLRVLAINDFHGALEPQVWPWSGGRAVGGAAALKSWLRSEEHTSELQSRLHLVCRLLLEKKKKKSTSRLPVTTQRIRP